VSPLLIVKDNK